MQFFSTAFLFAAIANAYTGSFFASIDDKDVQLQYYTYDGVSFIGKGSEDDLTLPLLTLEGSEISYINPTFGKQSLGLVDGEIAISLPERVIPLELDLRFNDQVANLELEMCEGRSWMPLREAGFASPYNSRCTRARVYFVPGLA